MSGHSRSDGAVAGGRAASHRRPPGIRPALAAGLVLSLFTVTFAAADWTTVANEVGDGVQADTARVTNSAGHSLVVYRDPDGVVRGTFSISPDDPPLDPQSCPTFRIDSQPPRALAGLDGPCDVESHRARFALGVVSDGVIESTLLTQLMNGTKIVVWYHVQQRGYRETELTLRRSMQALLDAVGHQVQVLSP
ncbi:MAG: hypothetical protein R3174_11155 [Gammaproteobacteria bacterium]|nr:hypothetical protein [Gammaproteobacteria bacterium]